MSTLNLPKTTIGQVKKNLLKYYTNAIEQEVDMKTLRSVCLWSLPGIGKSEVVRQIAAGLEHRTKYRFEFREVRLSDCTIFELLGLMSRNTKDNTVEYVEPPIYKEPDHTNTYVVYLFDELDKASPQLLAAALHLILDKCFWQYSLPANSIVIAAGNPENIDGEMFSKFKPELNNRFRHYLIEADFQCWKEWALEHEVNRYVLNFLSANNNMIYASDSGEESAAFASPRSWKAVSDYMNLMESGEEMDWGDCYLDICGDIGQSAALAFKAYCETQGCLPDMEDIFAGRVKKVPGKADLKMAVSRSMLTYIWEHRTNMTAAAWSNGCEYINKFPEDYAASFYKTVLNLDIDKAGILKTPEFQVWKRKHGRYM